MKHTNLTNTGTIKKILKEHGLSPNKNLGQHFITGKKFIERLVALADIQKNDIIVEVGPGLGAITERLAENAQHIVAIEADTGLCRFLQNHFKNTPNLTVVNQDVLRVTENDLPKNYKLISNLPYQITSPFLGKFLWELNRRPARMVLGVQKEVADRLTASPPYMNRLAVLAQSLARAQKHATFPHSCFYPQPQVSTSIITLFPKNIPTNLMPLAETLLETAQAGFNQKRKKLIKSLEKVQESSHLQNCWQKLNLISDIRPQEMTINQWLLLAQCLYRKRDQKN